LLRSRLSGLKRTVTTDDTNYPRIVDCCNGDDQLEAGLRWLTTETRHPSTAKLCKLLR
ncbi:hypothetical protein OS493_013394, partial [Desmophyllum pertusum]